MTWISSHRNKGKHEGHPVVTQRTRVLAAGTAPPLGAGLIKPPPLLCFQCKDCNINMQKQLQKPSLTKESQRLEMHLEPLVSLTSQEQQRCSTNDFVHRQA